MLIQYIITKTEYDEMLKMKQDNSTLLQQLKETTEKLFQRELKEWDDKKPQDRQKEFKETTCKCCRGFCDEAGSRCRISSEIGKPTLSGNNISYRSCGKFEWS